VTTVARIAWEDSHRPARATHSAAKPTSVGRGKVSVPASDPVHPIISGILGVVPTSRWIFAQVEREGNLTSLFGSHVDADEAARLCDELVRQRAKSPKGPRIAATLGSLHDFESGITLLFADARSTFGILMILRTAELGPFTSSEVAMLTFALDAASERFSALRLQPSPRTAEEPRQHPMGTASQQADGAFYVLDADLQIVLAWNAEDQRRIALTGLHTRIAERLPTVLEETVRALTVGWSSDSVNQPGISRPVPFLVVRTQPMSGPAGLFIGVHIDRFQEPNSLTGAADRFHISPREVQVLALLLDGKHLDQIAKQLYITPSTVQDHIKSMLDKTKSRNRSELIARVLGWESTVDNVRTDRGDFASLDATPCGSPLPQ
jgi:DNA-binding CsgD family transcriptional regulator